MVLDNPASREALTDFFELLLLIDQDTESDESFEDEEQEPENQDPESSLEDETEHDDEEEL